MCAHSDTMVATPDPLLLLREKLAEHNMTLQALAKCLGLNLSSVWRWTRADKHKRSRPDLIARKGLESMFGIPADLWLTPKERRALARAARVSAVAATGTEG